MIILCAAFTLMLFFGLMYMSFVVFAITLVFIIFFSLMLVPFFVFESMWCISSFIMLDIVLAVVIGLLYLKKNR
ncbi:hypothetical protein FACS189449_03010 [Alphaproteobacteria bacterium]|nr:hypothetical protein FACS189449_03010 [Alphaproteobacteria bacterium]